MKISAIVSFLFASQALAKSTLDWYKPKINSGAIYCVDDNKHYLECHKFGNKVANDIANGIMKHCKQASCDGEFKMHALDIKVSAVFPPKAKGEFKTQVHNILKKMHKTDPKKISTSPASLADITFPHKMILNRHANDNEKGHMTITITKNGSDGLCEVLKDIAAAGGTIPEVGPFFGLINIANC